MVRQFTEMIHLDAVFGFSKFEMEGKKILVDQIFGRQRNLGRENPKSTLRLLFCQK